ncbi:hypothetical protein Tco_1001267 [Tanacetum coccineum]
MFGQFMKMNTTSTSGSGSLPSNTVANPRGDLKAITTRSGISYDGPPIPPPSSSLPKVVEREPEVTKDTVLPSTENIQPPVVQTQIQIDEPVVAPKPKPTIPYPSRANKQKLREKDDKLALKFLEIFRKLHFELSFTDALLHMPKFASMFKSFLNNKEKLFELATTTSVNENCLEVILKKLLEKLGDPGKLLIPCDFPELDECLALADLASGNPTPSLDHSFLTLPRSHTLLRKETFIIGRKSKIVLTNCDSIPPGIDDDDFDLEGDLLLLEKLLHMTPIIVLTLRKNSAENLAADHLSRLENSHQDVLEKKEITETFPLDTLEMVTFRGDSSTPWFADIANYHAGNFIVKGMSSQQKEKFFKDVKHYFWDDLKLVWNLCGSND